MSCKHLTLKAIHFNIIASYEKREGGEPFLAQGDYAVCKKCREGVFIPHQKSLRVVPCVIDFKVTD